MARRRRFVPAAEAGRRLAAGRRLGPRLLSVTFDDGYADLYEYALPVLLRYGIPATVFVVSATLTDDVRVDWIDDPTSTPPDTLTVDEIIEMQDSGVEFGSHGHTHGDLTELSDDECERDLRTSKQALEDLLGRPASLLAYPRGLHDARVRRAAGRAGFSLAFTTSKHLGPVGPFAIPRVGLYAGDGIPSLALKTMPGYLRLKRALGR
jgi:peptidoglycan/xylan/chitin deacetylase (PgdA/CDA1 family)